MYEAGLTCNKMTGLFLLDSLVIHVLINSWRDSHICDISVKIAKCIYCLKVQLQKVALYTNKT